MLGVFEEFGLLGDQPPAFASYTDRHTSLELGRGYVRSEISVGSSAEISAALATTAAWKVWEDPACEHLGEVHLNHPDLGVFVADCDADGRPVFTSAEVDRLVTNTGGDRVQLGHLTGRTWELALEQLGEANEGILAAARRHRGIGSAAGSRAHPARVRVRLGGCQPMHPFRPGRRRLPIGRAAVRSATQPVASPWERTVPSTRKSVSPMTSSLKISSHDELIASVPHTLGFTPSESLVCLSFGDGPTARLDLPDSPEEMGGWLRTLTDVYLHRHHPRRVALVAYGEDGRRCIEALAALGDALGSDEGRGPDIGPVLWVNGEQWIDLLEGTQGTVDPSARARIDAEFALFGRVMPADGRDDLATAMKGDATGVAECLPAAWERFGDLDDRGLRGEVEWFGALLGRFHRDREYLSDVDAARVLVAISDTGIRDAAVFTMSRDDAAISSEFWQDLIRRAPVEVRDTPATMLAMSSFLEGRGAQAWVALDELSQSNQLASLVAAALTHAVDPREWDKALPAATDTLMQQAALRDNTAPSRAHDQAATDARSPASIDPDSSGPAAAR